MEIAYQARILGPGGGGHLLANDGGQVAGVTIVDRGRYRFHIIATLP